MARTTLCFLAAVAMVAALAADSRGWGSSRSFNGFAHGGAGEEGGGSRAPIGYSWSHGGNPYHNAYAHSAHHNNYYYYGDPYNEYCYVGVGGCTSAMVSRQGFHDAEPLPREQRYAYPTSGVYLGPSVAQPSANPSGPRPTSVALSIGVEAASLPAGATSETVNGVQYFRSGPDWYQMRSSAVGNYFVVVPAP